MEYINKGNEISSVQDVPPRSPLPVKSYTRYIQNYGRSRPKHRIGSDHQLWEPYTNIMFFAFSHHKEWNLTLSKSWIIGVSTLLKILLLRSPHISHTHTGAKAVEGTSGVTLMNLYNVWIVRNDLLSWGGPYQTHQSTPWHAAITTRIHHNGGTNGALTPRDRSQTHMYLPRPV